MEGYGDIRVEVLPAGRAVHVVIENVDHVPTFKHNYFSVRATAGQGPSVVFDKDACTVQLKSGTSVCLPHFGSLFFVQACPLLPPEHDFVTPTRGLCLPRHQLTLSRTTVRMAKFMRHCSGRQPSKLALFWKGRCTSTKGARWQKDSESPCRGRYTSEQIRSLDRCCRPERAETSRVERPNRYVMIVIYDYSRFLLVYFMRHKSDVAEAFRRFIADNRAIRIPSDVEIVRPNGGGEFL